MIEREAWLALARVFSAPRAERYTEGWCTMHGLCCGVATLTAVGPVVRARMAKAIEAALGPTRAYLADYTDAGDKVRVRFCRRMARKRAKRRRITITVRPPEER